MGDTLEGPLLWAYDRSHCLAFQGEDQFLLASVALILPTLRLCGLYGRRRYRFKTSIGIGTEAPVRSGNEMWRLCSVSSTTSICVNLLALHLLGEVYSSSSVTGVSKHMCSAPRIGSLVNVMVVVMIMFTIFLMAMFFTILYLGKFFMTFAIRRRPSPRPVPPPSATAPCAGPG